MHDIARSAIRATLMTRSRATYEPRPNHVLLVRPDHLGDVLFLKPGLKRFRHALQDWHISVAVGPWSRSIIEHDPNVDRIITVPFPGFTRSVSKSPWKPYQLLLQQAEILRNMRPAAVVVLRDDHWWGALMARVAGSPLIIGADHPTMNGLLTDSVPIQSAHWVARNIKMLDVAARKLGADLAANEPTPLSDPLTWVVSEQERSSASALLESAGVCGPIAVIHPGSGAPVKLWPTERWARIADDLANQGFSVVLTGSEAERPLVTHIEDAAQSTPTSIAGRTDIGVLAAVFERARVVAGVDSGPLHLAVAVGAPTIHIFGPSDVNSYGPWGDSERHRVVTAGLSCPRCGDLSLSRSEGAGCMLAVTVESVLGSIQDLLALNG